MLAVADTVLTNGLSKLFSNNGAASNFPINVHPLPTGQKSGRDPWSHKMPAGNCQPTTD